MSKNWLKFKQFRFSTLIALVIVYYGAYYLLLSDNSFNTSISSIINHSHRLAVTEHFLVLAFLPIYIAAIIFGAGILGMYLGTAIRYLWKHRFIAPE